MKILTMQDSKERHNDSGFFSVLLQNPKAAQSAAVKIFFLTISRLRSPSPLVPVGGKQIFRNIRLYIYLEIPFRFNHKLSAHSFREV
jgi:hypothetical protein